MTKRHTWAAPSAPKPRSSAGDPGQYLPLLARAAADRARARAHPLTRAAALAAAPWDSATMPAAWEMPFRTAYADRLEELGAALPAAPSGSRNEGGKTDLVQCRLYLSEQERDQQYALAKAAGVSWSTWARRKLAT